VPYAVKTLRVEPAANEPDKPWSPPAVWRVLRMARALPVWQGNELCAAPGRSTKEDGAVSRVHEMLSWYGSDNSGTLTNLAQTVAALARFLAAMPSNAPIQTR
jgi:hypothetical protein